MPTRDAKFYGVHACLAVFEARPGDVHRAFVTEATLPIFGEVLKSLASRRRPYRVVDDEELSKVAGTRHHEGVCLVAEPVPEPSTRALLDRLTETGGPARLVYLDGVDNPHNVGAILRTAAHFGAAALIGDREQLPSPAGAVARVAEGGAERVPLLRWSKPERSLRRLAEEGFEPIGTSADAGEALFAAPLPPRCVFLVGAERSGLSPAIRRVARRTVAIDGTGAVESLNVSNAAAVLLAEHYRRFST